MSSSLPNLLAAVLLSIFILLSLLHVLWALGWRWGMGSALPEIEGKPVFMPGTFVTLVVAAALAVCALLVAAVVGWVVLPLPEQWIRWLASAMAVAFGLRAVGELRFVGFFKRVRGTRFARMDSLVYSPLCLLLALGTAALLVLTRG